MTWFLRDADGRITDLGLLSCNLILTSLGAICIAAAARRFQARDLPAPI